MLIDTRGGTTYFAVMKPNMPGRRSAWPLSHHNNLVLLAGLMMSTGLPPFPGTGLLVVLALSMLLHLLLVADRPGKTAWLFALAHQSTLLYWMFFLDPSKSIPTRWLIPVQAIMTVLYVAVFYLVFGWVFGIVKRRLGTPAALSLAPVLWTGMEAWRGMGEMSFPWCLSGSAWIGTPLMGLAAACGELGLGAATILTAAALLAAMSLGGRYKLQEGGGGGLWRPALILAAVVAWIALAVGAGSRDGNDQAPLMPPVRVAAVQADVALRDKWQAAKIDSTVQPYTELTAEAAERGAEFVVWAETAVPAYLMYDIQLLNWVRRTVTGARVHLFTGFPDARRNSDGELIKYNSSGLFTPEGIKTDGYSKHHLLPIGEKMPFSKYLPFLAKVDLGQAEWSEGERPEAIIVPTAGGDFRFAGLICFESILSDLPRQAVADSAHCLVNITNDGWFGDTAGPRQHAILSRMRAVECGVPLIRCANNGISMIVDSDGRVQRSLGIGRRGFVMDEVLRGAGGTFYVRHGYVPLLIALIAWSAVALILTRSRERS